MATNGSHSAKVRPYAIPTAHRMTCRATALKKIRSSICRRSIASGGLLIALAALMLSPGGEPVRNHGCDVARIIQRTVAHPLAGRLVANHQAGAVVGELILVWSGSLPEFLPDHFDVFLLSSQEEPSRPGMKFSGVGFQRLRRVVLRINADGIKEDVFSHAITEQLLHLGQLGSFERAGIAALGIDEINDYRLAFNEVIIKMDSFPVLVHQWRIGEVGCARAARAYLSGTE